MKQLVHYTLTTGHSRMSPRSEVQDDVVEFMKQFVVPGKHRLPTGPYSVEVSSEGAGLLATVWQVKRPIVTFGVAESDEAANVIWPHLIAIHESTGSIITPSQPATTPWCSVVVIAPTPGESWIGDFERCLAWAWIESRRC